MGTKRSVYFFKVKSLEISEVDFCFPYINEWMLDSKETNLDAASE